MNRLWPLLGGSNFPISISVTDTTWQCIVQVAKPVASSEVLNAEDSRHSHTVCLSMCRREYLVGGLEHEFDFSIYWEVHHPNWRTHIFQRGGSTTNQIFWSPNKSWTGRTGVDKFTWTDKFWLLVSNIFSISYMGCHPSHWRTHIFQRGGSTINQNWLIAKGCFTATCIFLIHWDSTKVFVWFL